MNRPPEQASLAAIRAAAAGWVVRRERGLTAAEATDYELWIAADEQHAAAMQAAGEAWDRLDLLPDSLAESILRTAARRRRNRRIIGYAGLLAAAAAFIIAVLPELSPAPRADRQTEAASFGSMVLSDGSIVRRNAGAVIREGFTAGERRVHLDRGEAHFSVTKDPARPFIVHAGRIEVRAVGTAFNVNWQSGALEVLVTEGVVRLSAHQAPTAMLPRGETQALRLVNSGHRAVIDLGSDSPAGSVVVVAVNEEEISRSLAWSKDLVRLGGATLGEVIAAMSERTGRRIVLTDPALAGLRLGGRLQPDDIDGFTSLLANTLDLEIEHAADGTLVLHKKNQDSR